MRNIRIYFAVLRSSVRFYGGDYWAFATMTHWRVIAYRVARMVREFRSLVIIEEALDVIISYLAG